ncbi:MAG TPA: ATP-binding cassette domain-containing protein [Thermoanaerobaculia bacterium]
MSIALDAVTKHYAGQVTVDRVSLEVETGELFVLLGSSGSGKSTILRLIAGLAPPDEGTIQLDGRDVTRVPTQERGVGFVFQNYSIFRHMTVAENIEFGLRIRGVKKAERASRRDELLDLVGLGGLGGRYESQISGGQQQRVALARALAYQPRVLLLDEPFGALDVKIRTQLRQSLKEIQRSLGITTILVTHDQEEAFELGRRIGVVDRGRLLEVGAPHDLYERPRSLYVATFLGAGTILVGRCRNDRVELGPLTLPIPADVPHDEGDRVRVLVRPEQVALAAAQPPPAAASLGRGEVVDQAFSGPLRRIRVRLPPLPGVRQVVPPPAFGEEGVLLEAAVPAHAEKPPEKPWVVLEAWHILRQPTPRLLVCDEGDGIAPALELAQPLVDSLDAVATVLGVATDARRQDTLREALTRRAAAAGLDATVLRVRRGDPAVEIAAEQREAPYDFVVVGAGEMESRRRRGPSPALGEQLAGRIATPLLLARGRPRKPERILICTAVGEPGKADVRAGGWLARRLGATVTLLYVTRPGYLPPPLVRQHLERGVATLRELGVAGEFSVREAESAIEGILGQLRDKPHDLVVVGASAAGARVTRQVLRQSGCSVLVVPHGSW